MGVKDLTTFVNKLDPQIWTKGSLKGTKVIVDGYGLVFDLLEKSCENRYGGQYDQFSIEIDKLFASFKEQNIEAYVVLDGPTAAIDKKLQTRIDRAKATISRCRDVSKGKSGNGTVFPLLATRAFVQKLASLQVPFVVCDGEADREIASLAHQWDCPVLSNDSDFFIYDIPAFIPINHLHYDKKKVWVIHGIYHRNNLLIRLGIDKSFLPLLASLLSNDFVSQEVVFPFYHALKLNGNSDIATKIKTICNFLRGYENIDKAIQSVLKDLQGNDKVLLKKALSQSLPEYDTSSQMLTSYFEDKEIHTALEVPKFVIERYRQGKFPSSYLGVIISGRIILKFQVEDIQKKSSNRCSRKLREAIYSIIMKAGESVQEWDRRGCKLEEYTIKVGINSLTKDFHLENLEKTSKEERKKLLLQLLVSGNEDVLQLTEDEQLFVMSIRYWISHAEPKTTEMFVQSLILQHFFLKATKAPFSWGKTYDIELQHSLAQWQNIMDVAILLNHILLDVFQEPAIATLFNGYYSQAIMKILSKGIYFQFREI